MATVFVGGSALLLAGAMAALAFGFANGEESLVWTALVASGGAAVFLVIAYVVSRRELKAGRRAGATQVDAGTTSTSTASTSTNEPRATSPVEAASQEQQTEVRESAASGAGTGIASAGQEDEETQGDDAAPATGARAAGSPTAPKPSTSKRSSAPGTAAAAKPSSPSDQVVAVASKKRFHRPDCRYAKIDGAEDTTRASARRRGYTPCGICKP